MDSPHTYNANDFPLLEKRKREKGRKKKKKKKWTDWKIRKIGTDLFFVWLSEGSPKTICVCIPRHLYIDTGRRDSSRSLH